MTEDQDLYQGKSIADLGQEAGWFVLHTLIAIAVVMLILFGGVAMHVDPDTENPKVIATFLSLVLPLIVGFLFIRMRPDSIARYVWISGLILFSIVCVWVLELPTGNGLCEHCGAMDKLTRTFFSIDNGSGLASGWGLVLGTWVPLALVGYAIGGRMALGREIEGNV